MSAVATPAPLHSLETIHPFQPTQNYFQLIGWAFLPGSAAPNEVRVCFGERTFTPVERITRSDVAAAFPGEAAAAGSGFKFICYLPFGFYEGWLEVSADGADWHRVRPLAVPVSSHPILGAIEKPPAEQVITRPARIEGWCFHPEFDVRVIGQTARRYGLQAPQGFDLALDGSAVHCAMQAYAELHGEWSAEKGRYRWQKLSAAAAQQGVTVTNAHRALGDCLMTLGVVRAMASTENA